MGRVKTRLAERIGDKLALTIYEKLLKHTLSVCSHIEHCTVWYFISEKKLSDIDPSNCMLQKGKDLGERMANAFDEVFNQGYNQVICIGSDLPDMNQELINVAFEHLDSNDLVIGQAKDGGYYLIGMNSLRRELFEGINWSTNEVLAQTLAKVESIEVKVELLRELRDIDTLEDLLNFPEYALLLNNSNLE